MKQIRRETNRCAVTGKMVRWVTAIELLSGIGDDGRSVAYDAGPTRCHNVPECSSAGLLDRCPLRLAEQ